MSFNEAVEKLDEGKLETLPSRSEEDLWESGASTISRISSPSS